MSPPPTAFLDDHEPQLDPAYLAAIDTSYTSRLSRVPAPKPAPPSPSLVPITTHSFNRHDSLHSLHIRQATPPTATFAIILGPNSQPIHLNSQHPVLRRTASGRLFQPSNRVIHAVETMDPLPTEEEEDAKLVRWARGEDGSVERRRGNGKGKRVMTRNGTVARQVMRLEGVERERVEVTGLGWNVDEGEETSLSGGLVGTGRLDYGDVSAILGVEYSERVLERADDEQDVWMELARE